MVNAPPGNVKAIPYCENAGFVYNERYKNKGRGDTGEADERRTETGGGMEKSCGIYGIEQMFVQNIVVSDCVKYGI